MVIPTDSFLLIVLASLFLGYVIAILLAPFRVHAQQWQSADPHYEPREDEAIPHDVRWIIEDLESLGFQVRGHWGTKNSIAKAQLTLMEHPNTLDLGNVIDTRARLRRHITLFFQTRFADGTLLVTSNNRITVGLPLSPEATPVWLPEVRDPRHLYAVHQQVRESMMLGKKPLGVGPDPIAFLIARSKENLQQFANGGYFYLDEAGGVYRPTWKGAFLMTWRLLPPIRPFYVAWRRRRTRKLLRHLGIGLARD
ncbi:MAG TPA: hypothetical protein VFA18_17220 [Gemmataceae bacterium]|nr:hypothetical protein [Gemmataceae bacterium]